MPRSVPARRFTDRLMCARRDASPRAAKSAAPHARAKNPRSSSNRSTSTTYTPAIAVSVNVMSAVSHDADLGHGDDEASAASPVLRLLREDLVGEVPRQQQHVLGLPFEQDRRR